MNRMLKSISVAVLFAAGAVAQAETTANVALTTNYLFRGVSLSDNDPAIQGGFDFDNDNGFYAGLWGSSIASAGGESSGLELDLYAGFSGTTARGYDWDVGLITYTLPGSDGEDLNELYLGAGGQTWSMYAWNDWDSETTYAELNGQWSLQDDFGIGVHMGYLFFYNNEDDLGNANEDVLDYNLSFLRSMKGFDWEFVISHTNDDANDDVKFVLTLSRQL